MKTRFTCGTCKRHRRMRRRRMSLFLLLALFGIVVSNFVHASPTTVTITNPTSGTVFTEGDTVRITLTSTNDYGVTPNPNWTLTSSIGGSFATPTKSGNAWTDDWTTPIVTVNSNGIITANDGSGQASITVSVITKATSNGGIVSSPTNSTTTSNPNPASVPLYYFPVVLFLVFVPLMLAYLLRHRRHKKRPTGAKWSERF